MLRIVRLSALKYLSIRKGISMRDKNEICVYVEIVNAIEIFVISNKCAICTRDPSGRRHSKCDEFCSLLFL